uniref:Uncharacterized protein n=1 Tax=Oryza rufipogon TaxID=4529 RepID=A0A0E0PL74_ORYRU
MLSESLNAVVSEENAFSASRPKKRKHYYKNTKTYFINNNDNTRTSQAQKHRRRKGRVPPSPPNRRLHHRDTGPPLAPLPLDPTEGRAPSLPATMGGGGGAASPPVGEGEVERRLRRWGRGVAPLAPSF